MDRGKSQFCTLLPPHNVIFLPLKPFLYSHSPSHPFPRSGFSSLFSLFLSSLCLSLFDGGGSVISIKPLFFFFLFLLLLLPPHSSFFSFLFLLPLRLVPGTSILATSPLAYGVQSENPPLYVKLRSRSSLVSFLYRFPPSSFLFCGRILSVTGHHFRRNASIATPRLLVHRSQ